MMSGVANFVQSLMSESNHIQVGIVDSFDEATQRINATVAIKNLNGDKVSQLVNVPVCFIRHGEFAVTLPVKKGNECILFFADRCLDNWKTEGGVSTQDEFRMYDLSDAIAIVGLAHDGNPLPDYNNTDLEVRNEAGDTKVAITAAGRIEMTSPVEVIITAPLSIINGDVEINGNAEINGDVEINGNVEVDGTIDATDIIHSDVDVTTSINSVDDHSHDTVNGTSPPITSIAHTP